MNPKNLVESEPKLQPPGAGLPLPQRLLLKLVVGPIVSKRGTPEVHRRNYEKLTNALIDKVSKVSAEERSIKILVPPQRGLEDSSRYWSINGVLEHLLIVSKSMEQVVLSLAANKTLNEVADIAKVKPHQKGQDFLKEFTEYAPGLMARLDDALSMPGLDLNSKMKFNHPWFGPMNARQWYWLLGMHTGIHYQQAKEIIKGLN